MEKYFIGDIRFNSLKLSKRTIQDLTFEDSDVLIYFEGPKFFILRNQKEKRNFFMYWIGDELNDDGTSVSEKFLLSEVTERNIERYKNNEICLNEFLNSGIQRFMINDHFDFVSFSDLTFSEIQYAINKVKKGLYYKK